MCFKDYALESNVSSREE